MGQANLKKSLNKKRLRFFHLMNKISNYSKQEITEFADRRKL